LKDVESIISQLEQQKTAIERAISALRDITTPEPVPVKRGRPGRPPGRPPAVAKKRRRLSPEGRQRIIEALKKRWAEKKAGAKKATKRAARKGAASAA
jgi:hypothetical protein